MCLQDLQLARAASFRVHTATTTGSGLAFTLPPNRDRVGIYLIGPSAGNLECRLDVNNGASTIMSTAGSPMGPPNRSLWIQQAGPLLKRTLQFNVTAAATLTVFEYFLPLDEDSLLIAARTGNF